MPPPERQPRSALKSIRSLLLLLALLLLVAAPLALWTPDRDRAALEQRYLRWAGDLVEVDGLRLHVRDEGPRGAPALLLLHGFGASLHTWEPWAQALRGDHRVIRIDLPGHGLTGPDPDGDYSDARAHRLLLALLDRLGVERASLVGSSIGGRIAWSFAARHPQRVERLVLIAPDGFASPGRGYGQVPAVPWAMQLARWTLPRPLLRWGLAPAYADPQAVLTDALLERYHELVLAPGVRAAMAQRLAQTLIEDPVPLLRRITAPTLLLWGELDALIPVANADDYLAALPDARKIVLPGIGHLPHEEDPAGSLPPVRAFLDAGRATAGR
jgi:pimeloyl-ACP methyl ester carboxylesterase